MSTQYLNSGTFLANSALTAFRLVTISSNLGVGLCATGGVVDGVTQVDAASGDYVTVGFLGNNTIKVALLAGPVTVGNTLFAVAGGLVAITGTITVGKSLSTASDANAVVEILPRNL